MRHLGQISNSQQSATMHKYTYNPHKTAHDKIHNDPSRDFIHQSSIMMHIEANTTNENGKPNRGRIQRATIVETTNHEKQ